MDVDFCDNCGRVCGGMKVDYHLRKCSGRCSSTNFASYYCSQECQKKAWHDYHRLVCRNQSSSSSTGTAYEIVDIPGKGKGVITKRHYKRGDIIMSESPVLVVPHRDGYFDRQVLGDQIDALAPELLERVLDLSDVYSHPDSALGNRVENVLHTNSFSGLTTTDSTPQSCLLLNIARCNHSCTPNASLIEPNGGNIYRLVCVHDIQMGEEVTVSYADVRLPRAGRINHLQDRYRFRCQCQCCMLSDDQSRASDQRRSLIRSVDDISIKLCDSPTSLNENDYTDVKKCIDLCIQEGIFTEVLFEVTEIASTVAGHLNHGNDYIKHTLDAWHQAIVLFGPGSYHELRMRARMDAIKKSLKSGANGYCDR